MSEFRGLQQNEIESYVRLAVAAFASEGLSEAGLEECREFFNIIPERIPSRHMYGLFREGKLMGGMHLIDFQMNILSVIVPVGGAASVAADLLHKREGVAKDMMKAFMENCRAKGTPMAVLYPFRSDFYKKLGFGLGTEIRQYKIKPSSFPAGHRKHLEYLSIENDEAVADCYHRFAEKNHGMLRKTGPEYHRLFEMGNNRIVGYRKGDRVLGYISFTYSRGREYQKYMVINEFIYETREAFGELCAFLNSQSDQFERIILNTQDESFHFLVDNPADGSFIEVFEPHICISTTAVGMMYRVIDTARLFELLAGHDFNGQSCRLRLTVQDDLLEANNRSLVIHFTEGRTAIAEDGACDAEITMDISDFSSMVMGAVSFKSLYRHGRADISDSAWLDRVNRIFLTEQKPMCCSYF